LSQRTGHRYRLLTSAEWEYAGRAGTTAVNYWGQTLSHEYANYGAPKYRFGRCCNGYAEGRDKWANETAPVGSFPPNPWGLFDIAGNVAEWVEDCKHRTYDGAPVDGSAWTTGDCRARVLRGKTWNTTNVTMRIAGFAWAEPHEYSDAIGLRVARDL
jgi:formylglycine-generating enzyme required for sulfatase activity